LNQRRLDITSLQRVTRTRTHGHAHAHLQRIRTPGRRATAAYTATQERGCGVVASAGLRYPHTHAPNTMNNIIILKYNLNAMLTRLPKIHVNVIKRTYYDSYDSTILRQPNYNRTTSTIAKNAVLFITRECGLVPATPLLAPAHRRTPPSPLLTAPRDQGGRPSWETLLLQGTENMFSGSSGEKMGMFEFVPEWRYFSAVPGGF
jgi:hypothetical protein